MSNISTAVSNVIPFSFEGKEVRTLLIGTQPWFVASDVCASLAIGNVSLAVNGRADRESDGLDEDEKGIASVNTPSGMQQMLIVSESGLYALIFKSRKKEAKRFQKWVTAEVLPAIRKHGRYEATAGKMQDLLSGIGIDQQNILKALKKGKVANLPAEFQRKALARLGKQLNTAFGVRSIADIPASQFDAARNFVGSYALEGEWISGRVDELSEHGSPRDRFLVSYNYKGERQTTPVPPDACVMSHKQLIKAMVKDADLPVTPDEMYEFAVAALTNMKMRYDHQTWQLKQAKARATA